MKIFSAQLKGTTTVATGSNVSLTGSFSGSIAGIDINSTNTFTGSTSNRLNSIETISASNVSRLNSLETISASNVARLNSLETISASVLTLNSTQNDRLNSLETTSASVDTLNNNQNTRLNNLENKTGSLATTGSNTFYGTQVFSGSVYIKENLIVQGSSSLQNITASAVDIGTNKIILNVDNPAVRFAGISVYDSGSTQGTGSLWWDSTQNHWLYEHPSDSAAPYNSAILISGPKNTGNLGEETELVSNFVMKAVGGDHISASAIYDDGSNISLKSNTQITGSLSVMGDGGVLNRTTSGEPYLFFRKNGVNRGSIYGIDGGGIRIFDESDNQVLTITGSKVGIGTANPFGSLHVVNNTNTYVRIQATANNGSAELDLLSNGGQNSYIDFGPNDLRFRSTNSDMSALNNSAVLSLTNGGRVGIGTTDPGYKFHISGSSQVTSYFQTSGTYAPISWTGDNGTTKGGVTAHSGYITIGQLNSGGTGVDGDRALTIISGSGFVGINTTSTNAPLTIKTSGDTQDGTFYSTLTINNTGTSTFSRVRFDRSGVAKWGLTLASNDTFRISNLYENGSVTANDATFVIKNDNYVGIGVTNPLHRLAVNGNAKFIITPGASSDGDRVTIAQNNGTYGIDLVAYGSGAQPYSSTQGIFSWGGYDGLIMAQNANIRFVTGQYTERMRLTNGGYLGIGTTNPTFKLHIVNTNGDDGTWAGGILVENTGSPAGEPSVAFKNTAVASGNYVFTGLNQSNNYSVAFGTSFTDANTKFQITSGGQILTWGNPAFMAYGNGNASIDYNGTYLIYPSVHVNRGGHYNASNGIFTAPVAGIYYFSWSDIGGNAQEVYRFFLRINDSTFLSDYHLRLDTGATGSEYGTNGNRSAIVNLSANDTVRIWFRNDAGATMYGINESTNSYHNFMGYLIG